MIDGKSLSKDNDLFQRESVYLDYAQLNNMIIANLNNPSENTIVSTKYTSSNYDNYISSPLRYAKQLGGMSESLYYSSPHYRRIINYFANMPTLDYILEPVGLDLTKNVNVKSFRSAYQKTLDYVEMLNIKHEFKKIMKIAWIKDTFYGYQHVGKDSSFIQELPFDYCQISSIEDGVYNVSFNFQYFDRNPAKLNYYPKEFKSLFNKYKSGKGYWQELDSSNTIVLKINEESVYDLPPFMGVFKDIFNISDYKALKKVSTTMDNYKFVVQRIPIRNNSERNNDFLIDLKNVAMFHNKTSLTLPDGIGLITTPFEVGTINFATDKSQTDNVLEAERQLYTSVGSSSEIFNGEKSSDKSLGSSINADEQDVFTLLRQIERVINRKIKNDVKGTFQFRIKILDATTFNRDTVISNYLKSAQFGLPVKMLLCASLGLAPNDVTNMVYLENTVLDLVNSFIPLASSHTQSGSTGGSANSNGQPNVLNVNDPTNQGGRPPIDPNSPQGNQGG